jgi:hypothetical protein
MIVRIIAVIWEECRNYSFIVKMQMERYTHRTDKVTLSVSLLVSSFNAEDPENRGDMFPRNVSLFQLITLVISNNTQFSISTDERM